MKWPGLIMSCAVLLPLFVGLPSVQSSGFQRNEVFPYDDALRAPTAVGGDPGPMAGAPPVPGYFDLTEYMMGSVVVGVVLLESDGSTDPNTEDWDFFRQDEVRTEIEAGLSWWTMQDARARLSFVYEYHMSVPTGYEPINHNGPFDQGLWIGDAMSHLGYGNFSYFNSVRAWVNDLRIAYATDWAFAIFVVDSLNDPDGTFTTGYCAYAYLGGPFFIMTYDNDGYGIGNMDFVAAHEMGHTFYATDEYNGDPEYSGYLDVLDVEYSGCIMHQALSWCISSGTLGQIGWQDTDGDNVFDILDVPPDTLLEPYLPDPTGNQTPTYIGIANVVAYPNGNPFGPGNDITISDLTDLEYSVDSSLWQPGQAADGSFNEATEDYLFTTFAVGSGTHQVNARAVNTEGNRDTTPAMDILTVDIDKPTSALLPFPSVVNWTVLVLPANAFDNFGLASVELWYSYESAPFSFMGADTAAPWQSDFDTAISGDGNYSFFTIAVDVVDNREDPPPVPDLQVLVDTIAPWSSAIQPAQMMSQATFQIDATAGDRGLLQAVEMFYRCGGSGWTLLGGLSSRPWSWVVDTASLCGDGVYEFHTIALDTAGNIETAPATPDATVLVDTNPPTSSLNPLPPFTNQSMFMVIAVPADANGISSVEIWFNFDSTGMSLLAFLSSPPWTALTDTSSIGGDGRYDFYSRAIDLAGNAEQMHSLPDAATIVDTTPPDATVSALQQYTRVAEFPVSSNAQDANGVASTELWYRKDGGAWTLFSTISSPPWTWQFNVSSLGEGTYEFLSVAVDIAGNGETWNPVAEAATMVDLTPPIIQFAAPNPGVWIISMPLIIDWTGTDNLSGIERYTLEFAGGNETLSAFVTEFLASTVQDGIHHAILGARDRAGNTAVVQLTIGVDMTAPDLAIDAPVNGSSVVSPVVVLWHGSDMTSGLDRYEYSIDDGGFMDVALDTNKALDLDPGSHRVVVRAHDVARNMREVSRTFSVAERPPTVDGLTVLLIAVVVLITVLVILLLILMKRRKKKKNEEQLPPPPPPDI